MRKMMKSSRVMLCGLTALAMAGAMDVGAQNNVKTLLLKQDDAQETMVSKVYQLKYTLAGDMIPFIQGAIKRYNTNSTIDQLNYKVGKKRFIVVSTPAKMMKCVDEMVANLDRPCPQKDNLGSIIEGTGIYRFSYLPQYRSSDTMVNILTYSVCSGDGTAFRDPNSNIIYWKDALSHGVDDVLKWVKAFDRPVPQVELNFKVYEVRQSVLDDAGLDYLAWKNGPGLNMFSVGSETLLSQISENSLSNMDKFTSYSYGGFFAAPQFDMSFIRMLSQEGNANIAATGTLTVINSVKTYAVKFQPQNQLISKDSTDKTSIGSSGATNFSITVASPTICFRRVGEVDKVYNGDGFDQTTYASLGGTIDFNYVITHSNSVEQNNRGDELTENSNVISTLTTDLNREHLLGVYNANWKVDQTTGIPFLCEVPVLKYIFGSTTTVNEEVKYFVTVTPRLAHPEDNYAAWAGKLLAKEDLDK